jgi:PAS domain S-box-containing protein
VTPAEARGDGLDPRVLRAALDASHLLVLAVDGDGQVLAANEAVQHATGLPRDQCERPVWELAALPDERRRLRALFPTHDAETPTSGLLFHLIDARGGGPRVVNWDVRRPGAHEKGGDGIALVLSGLDVTDRLAAERRLHETEVFQREILDRLPALVWTTDRELRITSSSGGDLLQVELRSAQIVLVGATLYSYLGTDDPKHPAIAPHLRALEGASTQFEVDWFGRRFASRVDPLRDTRGAVIGTIGLAMDITEKARTAAALVESRAHVQLLVDANVVGIAFWKEDGRVTEANQALLDLVGYTREELLSGEISWQALTPCEYALRDADALAQVRATGRCTPYEKEYVAKNGTRVPVLVGSAAPLANPEQGVSFVVDMREQARLRDARDKLLLDEQRARIETELANARLMLLVDGSKRLSQTKGPGDTLETLAALVVPGLADWSYVIHRGWDDGPAVVASAHGDPNKRALLRRLHGFTPDRGALEGAPRVFRTGEVAQYDDVGDDQLTPNAPGGTVVGTRDPSYLHVVRELGLRSMLCVPIAGRTGTDGVIMLVSAGDPRRYDSEDLVLARDLAARAAISLENNRLLVEALDAVRVRDDFLAVAAHELRTPLTSLLLQIQLLERAVNRERLDAPSARRGLSAAQNQAHRLSTLVDGLLDVARLASNRLMLEVEDLDLRTVVEGLLATMAPDFRRAGCDVTLAAPEAVTGRWDRVRLEQVLTNLLTNAMKFGAGRPIEVKIEATPAQAELSVRDHGIGISKADQERIFGRFERAVSTKHFGGLGLGLHISAQIMRAHHGSMRVQSEPGRGACFIVTLPRRLPRATISAGLSSPVGP